MLEITTDRLTGEEDSEQMLTWDLDHARPVSGGGRKLSKFDRLSKGIDKTAKMVDVAGRDEQQQEEQDGHEAG
jgi:hypothetical protein